MSRNSRGFPLLLFLLFFFHFLHSSFETLNALLGTQSPLLANFTIPRDVVFQAASETRKLSVKREANVRHTETDRESDRNRVDFEVQWRSPCNFKDCIERRGTMTTGSATSASRSTSGCAGETATRKINDVSCPASCLASIERWTALSIPLGL